MKEQFSLVRAIQENLSGKRYSETTQKVLEEGKSLMDQTGIRAQGMTIPFESRALVLADSHMTQSFDFADALRNELVLLKAGAILLSGLTGSEVLVPSYAGAQAGWCGELASGADNSGLFSSVIMIPKRLYVEMHISKVFLLQVSPSVETLFFKDLVNAIASKLESTILGNSNSVPDQPDGLFTGITDELLTVKGAASLENVVELETTLNNSNVSRNSRAYITNSTALSILKKTPKIAGYPVYLCEDGKMNDYPVFGTNGVASGLATAKDENGLIFGNWSDLVIGQWGALDLLIDPFSLANKGELLIGINAYFNTAKRHKESFVLGSVK